MPWNLHMDENHQNRTHFEKGLKNTYYDLVGKWNIPIVHMGGVAATEHLLAMVQIRDESIVLDVGCGTGFTACQIAKKYKCQVFGVDLSEKMIERARERAQKENVRLEFKVADTTELPFEAATFDIVIMESFLNILGDPRIIEKALHEISRVTKKGGRIGANEVWRDESAPPELLKTIREKLEDSIGPGQGLGQYTLEEFCQFFEEAGLKVIQIEKKPPTDIGKDVMKVMGVTGFVTYAVKALYDIVTDPVVRRGVINAVPAKRIMERKKDTKKYFGYALIVAQK